METFTATTAVLAALIYAALCWVRPFADCGSCGGTGRRPAGRLRRARPCRRCRETGKRLRIGRRVWNYSRRLHREGTA